MITSLAPASRGVSSCPPSPPAFPHRRAAIASTIGVLSLAACGKAGAAAEPDGRLRPTDSLNAPSFILDSLAGGRVSLADASGRVLLLHFFATWCEPCRPELASLARLAARFDPADLAILAVSVAEVEARLTRFFTASPVPFPVLLDHDRAASRAWEVHALPTTFILDRVLTPRLAVRGDLDWQRPEIEAQLQGFVYATKPAHADSPGDRP